MVGKKSANIVAILMFLTFGVASVHAYSDVYPTELKLNLAQKNQEMSQWCWAATAQAIFEYYDIFLTQTEIAAYGTDGLNEWNWTCGSSTDPTRNGLDLIFAHWGLSSSSCQSSYDFSTIKLLTHAERRPFVIRWGWSSGGGHILAGHGYEVTGTDGDGNETGSVWIMDPLESRSGIWDHAYLSSNANWDWTHSLRMYTEPVDDAPVVDAGADTHTSSSYVELDGSVNDDLLALSSVEIEWSVVSEPAGADWSFDNTQDPKTGFTLDTEGTYVLRLTGWDGLHTEYDEVSIFYTEDQGSGLVRIKSAATNYFLRPENDQAEAGIILDVDDGSDWFKWERVANGDRFYLKNAHTGMYFRPIDETDGSLMRQVDVSYDGNWTQWSEVSTDDGLTVHFLNKQTGKYFRPIANEIGSQLEQRPTSWDGTWTRWQIMPETPPADAYYTIRNLATDRHMNGNGPDGTAQMVPKSWTGNFSQWQKEAIDGTWFRLKCRGSNKYLMAAPCETNGGALTMTDDASAAGEWKMTRIGAAFKLENANCSSNPYMYSGGSKGYPTLAPDNWAGNHTEWILTDM
ncbi:MAG: hypothetical protein GF344_17120 [Chitinivibrionales bacterium]|nr:hypothetical protein [Chitinivibrionales bacterium]MBD3358404.1 hypothetical protein [Chitinivibrionales bacterium]